jgi:hypothetical protein
MTVCRFEVHYHTQEVSICASVPAAESVIWYSRLGYDGLVVTDHYTRQFFERIRADDWINAVDAFWAGYAQAERAGRTVGLTVLPGMEIRFDENNNDYLVYGLTRQFLLEHPRLFEMNIRSFGTLARRHNMLVYQAHPLRNTMTIIRPQWLDGIESHNGNPRHDARNDIAALWAHKHSLKELSGSDFHNPGDEGRGGLAFIEPITDNPSLVMALSDQAYTLVLDPIDL